MLKGQVAPGTHIFCYGEGLHESVVRIFKSKVSEVEDRTSPGSVSGKLSNCVSMQVAYQEYSALLTDDNTIVSILLLWVFCGFTPKSCENERR